MLVYKSEIWPKNHLPLTKSDCIGFRITSGIPVVSYVSYVIQESENTASDGCIRNADIFSIKVDSRLKTILISHRSRPKMEFSSVFIHKFICSPKCRFRECSWREIGKCHIIPKHPLKLVNLAAIFTGISIYIRE